MAIVFQKRRSSSQGPKAPPAAHCRSVVSLHAMALVAAAWGAPVVLVRRVVALQAPARAAALQALQAPPAPPGPMAQLRLVPLVALDGALGLEALAGAAGNRSPSLQTPGADFQRSEAVDGGPCRSRRRHPGRREPHILTGRQRGIHGIFVASWLILNQ